MEDVKQWSRSTYQPPPVSILPFRVVRNLKRVNMTRWIVGKSYVWWCLQMKRRVIKLEGAHIHATVRCFSTVNLDTDPDPD